MEFRGEDDEMGFNVEQAVRGIIGCAAVLALFSAGAIGAALFFGVRWAFGL